MRLAVAIGTPVGVAALTVVANVFVSQANEFYAGAACMAMGKAW